MATAKEQTSIKGVRPMYESAPSLLASAKLRGEGVTLSPWMSDPDYPHACMRIIAGADPIDVRTRVAFIEKTGRVRTISAPLGITRSDSETDPGWVAVTRGDCGCLSDGQWEYDTDTQNECDTALRMLGYTLL